ncbi:ATPase [Alkalihalobacillus sp. MEB130]|uniref:N-acetylglucosamine kinase n=1 Tax=Alkalihalobacillus sp. MEB130 TaxID=2976704 RepID=UPI0028DD5002|nr:BadF/BadG/BcrA/BcrD ATPase family protein [Alkalihalobacillus sp. MEB130]MDT8860769.1 ATPase [Alkalihalobacillus sp. MEB130]
MFFLMGVDGGGSKTFTVICDEKGNMVGKGISECGNHQSNGINHAIANINESIESALKMAGLNKSNIDFVQFGLAGADREKDFSILLPALENLAFSNWDLVCDTMEGLRAGSADNVGVVLVCGTGTNAAGRNKDGKMVQTGGFGYLYGDFAGGGQMARETFRAAVRSWEHREDPSILTKKVPEFLNYPSMNELVNAFLDNDIFTVPNDLTRVLHDAAEEGDSVAIKILTNMGKELGLAAKSVIKRLGNLESPIPVVLTGSILQKGKNTYLLESIERSIISEYPEINLIIPTIEPVYGALLLAMDQLNITVTKEMYQSFESYGGYEG